MTQIGNEHEMFFNKESKDSTWEITYNSTDDKILLMHFKEQDSFASQKIDMSKLDFVKLKKFIKDIRLTKNKKIT